MEHSKGKVYSIVITMLIVLIVLAVVYVNHKTNQLQVVSQLNINLSIEVNSLAKETDSYLNEDSAAENLISQIDTSLSNLDSLESKAMPDLKGSSGSVSDFWSSYDDISVELTQMKEYLSVSPEKEEVKKIFVDFAESVKLHLLDSKKLVEFI